MVVYIVYDKKQLLIVNCQRRKGVGLHYCRVHD